MEEHLKNNERREWAKLLYTKEDKSARDVALEVNTDEATIRNWANEGAWDGMKRSLLLSKKTLLEHLYVLLEAHHAKMKEDGATSVKDVEIFMKYTATIKNLEAATTATDIMEVAGLFVKWLRKKDVELTKKVTLQLDAFIKQKLSTPLS